MSNKVKVLCGGSSHFIDWSRIVRFTELDSMGTVVGGLVGASNSVSDALDSGSLGVGPDGLGAEEFQLSLVANKKRLREKFGNDNPCKVEQICCGRHHMT
jgi:hypothetical protein